MSKLALENSRGIEFDNRQPFDSELKGYIPLTKIVNLKFG